MPIKVLPLCYTLSQQKCKHLAGVFQVWRQIGVQLCLHVYMC